MLPLNATVPVPYLFHSGLALPLNELLTVSVVPEPAVRTSHPALIPPPGPVTPALKLFRFGTERVALPVARIVLPVNVRLPGPVTTPPVVSFRALIVVVAGTVRVAALASRFGARFGSNPLAGTAAAYSAALSSRTPTAES